MLNNMCPSLPIHYFSDGLPTNSILCCYRSVKNAFGSLAANITHNILRNFCIAIALPFLHYVKMLRDSMVAILLRGNPFQISGGVVRFIAVDMINLREIKWVWNERLCYDAMKESASFNTITAKWHANITILALGKTQLQSFNLFQRAKSCVAESIQRFYAPRIGHFISAFIANNWKPNFFHLKFSIKELSLLKSARQAGNESAFWGIPLSAQKDYTPCQS